MNFLAIDTSMQQLSIAISINGKELSVVLDTPEKKHNSILMVYIDKILKEVNGSIKDIDVFGIVNGPGSFTGIRVGVATVNAFAFALKKKIVEITALELAIYANEEKNILAMIDCRHNNYYTALFDNGKLEYMELTAEQISSFNIPKVLYDKPDSKALLQVMKSKIKQNVFVGKSQPFYMKKSAAERFNFGK